MNRHLLAGAALLALAANPAMAADMAVKAPVYKAPPPVWSWTGAYLGGNIGYSWGRSSNTLTLSDATSGAVLNSSNASFDLDGLIGGGQIGYNWQFASNWVFGLEADFQGTGEKGSAGLVCAGGTIAVVNGACSRGHVGDTINDPALPVTDSLSEKLNWLGTVRGRLGPTITPTLLAYVTGGLAYGQVSASDTLGGTNVIGLNGANGATLVPVAASFSNTTNKVGWTAGFGLEGVLVGNWTAKVEYLYVDLGSVSGTFVTPITAPSGAFVAASYNSHITDNILRVGINYKFDAGGPVTARY